MDNHHNLSRQRPDVFLHGLLQGTGRSSSGREEKAES